eukprot:GHVN01081749.1.p1 GENE.GHVN01081749.1~~GHVN01081749.1.p1  ORF type:complete len:379 (+),score=92.14 GHVN01081749.1:1165-2301(+)
MFTHGAMITQQQSDGSNIRGMISNFTRLQSVTALSAGREAGRRGMVRGPPPGSETEKSSQSAQKNEPCEKVKHKPESSDASSESSDDGHADVGEVLSGWKPDENGATATVAAFVSGLIGKPNYLIVANAGDSRVVLSRDGRAVAMSVDHKPTNESEHQRIVAAGGLVCDERVDGNLNLSRSLGDLEYKRNYLLFPEAQKITSFPDVRVIEITDEDEFCILACDGIWDRMTNQKAVSFVRENEELTSLTSLTPSTSLLHSDLAVTCEKMCFQCLSGNPLLHEGAGCDNMTAMIVRFRSSLTSTPSASDDTSLELSTSLTSLYRYGKWGDDGPNTSELLDTTEGRATLLKARTTENATRPRKRADSSEESDEESTRQRGE